MLLRMNNGNTSEPLVYCHRQSGPQAFTKQQPQVHNYVPLMFRAVVAQQAFKWLPAANQAASVSNFLPATVYPSWHRVWYPHGSSPRLYAGTCSAYFCNAAGGKKFQKQLNIWYSLRMAPQRCVGYNRHRSDIVQSLIPGYHSTTSRPPRCLLLLAASKLRTHFVLFLLCRTTGD